MFFNACPKFGHPVRTLEIAESMAPVSMLQKKNQCSKAETISILTLQLSELWTGCPNLPYTLHDPINIISGSRRNPETV